MVSYKVEIENKATKFSWKDVEKCKKRYVGIYSIFENKFISFVQ